MRTVYASLWCLKLSVHGGSPTMTYTFSHLQDADFEEYDLAFLRRFSICFV